MLVAPHEGEGRSQVVQRDVNNDDADTTTAARREATHLIMPSTLPAASTTGAPEMRSVTSSWRHKGARWIPRRRPRVSYPATSVTSPNPLEMTATHLEDVKHGGVGGHGDGRRLHGISYPHVRQRQHPRRRRRLLGGTTTPCGDPAAGTPRVGSPVAGRRGKCGSLVAAAEPPSGGGRGAVCCALRQRAEGRHAWRATQPLPKGLQERFDEGQTRAPATCASCVAHSFY